MSVIKFIHLYCIIFGLGNRNPVKMTTKETQVESVYKNSIDITPLHGP